MNIMLLDYPKDEISPTNVDHNEINKINFNLGEWFGTFLY